MKPDRMTVLPGPLEHNEINDLECQPGVTAHTEPKGRIGEVSTRYWLWRLRGFFYLLYLNFTVFRRVWRDRWYISQAWSHAMNAESWADFYTDGYTAPEALREDASYG